MSKYKSFDNQKRKYEKMFENNEQNSSDIENNIKKLNVSYKSNTRYTSSNIINIIENETIDTAGQIFSIDLIDFPDWAINMSKPSIIVYGESAYNIQNEVNFSKANANGTLQIGDLQVTRYYITHWFTKKDSVYTLSIRFDVQVDAVVSKNMFGFSASKIPLFSDVSLYILNEKSYDEIQSGK